MTTNTMNIMGTRATIDLARHCCTVGAGEDKDALCTRTRSAAYPGLKIEDRERS